MEILDSKYQLLTNYEVLKALTEIKNQKTNRHLLNLSTISYETSTYLEKTPCAGQTKENIERFMIEAKKFRLTKSELLGMLNDPPSTPLHVQLIIESVEDRLKEDEVEELIKLSKEFLLPPAS